MKTSIFIAFATAFASAHEGHDDEDPISKVDQVTPALNLIELPSVVSGPFVEQFSADSPSRWIASQAKKVVDGVEDEDLLRYRGEWAFEEPTVWPGMTDDTALVVKTPAAHHAISSKFDTPIDPTGKTFVVQYEVKFQKQHDCGGAYVKLLTYDPEFDTSAFGDQTNYTIMFGPDKCGMNNKVHFIFRHQNPISKVWEEKHMNSPPAGKIEKKTGLYTLIIQPDNSFEMLINNESVKKGSLLSDFTPAVNPPKEDKKPSEWVDDERIPDVTAVKPDNWDESAPMEIVDEIATMPEDWLVDEEANVADPEAVKPDDWDDEEDGSWSAPTVPNPKCEEASGCGPWKSPMKSNPDYKGKWKVPLIDNPEYKGVWTARKIDNPEYFEDAHPANFNKMGAIGIELWTMSEGITFDNFYVGYNVDDAKIFAKEQWSVKYAAEKQYEELEEPIKISDETDSSDRVESLQDKALFYYRQMLNEVQVIKTMWTEEGPYATVVAFKFVFVSAIFFAWFTFSILTRLFSSSKPKSAKKKSSKDEDEQVEPVAVKKAGTAAARKRTTKKDDDDDE